MATFDEMSTAARLRDIIHREAIKAVREASPSYRYATVTQIDPDIRQIYVLFPGDPSPVPVKLVGIQPRYVGQVVQIGGRTGDFFVTGVVGASQFVDLPVGELTAPTGFEATPWVGSAILAWLPVNGVDRYEVQVAADAGFATVIASYVVKTPGYSIFDLEPGTTYFFRVRSVNANEGVSPWSATVSTVPTEFPGGNVSDGLPPEDSPDVVVTGGMGFLLAEWLEQPNQDLVSYDVHISTTSGFTPSASNKVGSTSGTFFFINKTGTGSPLLYDVVYHVRVIARDVDGAAGPGAQGSGSMERLRTSDVGVIPQSAISDNLPPSSSPDVASVTNGIGFLLAKWDHIANDDSVMYEVHISTGGAGFAPNTNTLIGETPGNSFFIRNQGPGMGGAPLVYGTTYFVKIWAKDIDGFAPGPGAAGSGVTVRVVGVDIGPNTITAENMVAGTITAASGVIANAAIGAANIQTAAIQSIHIGDAQITFAKIANASIGNVKIMDGAISTAKIGDGQITTAKIGFAQITNAQIANAAITETNIVNGAISNAKIQDASITNAKIANAAITNAKIANATITSANIADAAITNAKIQSLSAAKLTAGTITAQLTITAGDFRTSGVRGVRMSGNYGGSIELGYSGTPDSILRAVADFSSQLAADTLYLGPAYTRGLIIGYSNNVGVAVYVHPGQTGNHRFGSGGNRWHSLWAVNGTVQTSDMRAKKDVKALRRADARELGKRVNPKVYHMAEEEDDAPLHFGFDAAEIKSVADSLGIPFAGVYDPHQDPDLIGPEPDPIFDDEGVQINKRPHPDEVMMGLNYSELIPILWEWVSDIEDRLEESLTKGKK